MEMEQDNTNHYLIYQVLGFTKEQGYQIDLQQNVGRFLYKYAGSMLEDLTIECLKQVYPNAKIKVKLQNTIDKSPKKHLFSCNK